MKQKKRQEGEFNSIASFLNSLLTGKLSMKAGKVVVRAGRRYNNIDYKDIIF